MATFSSLLVTGGARSGKSGYAQSLAEASGLRKALIATADAGDDEMRERIDRHRRDRGADWRVIEDRRDIGERLREEAGEGRVVVVDCLTLWLSNLMFAGCDVDAEIEALTRCVLELSARRHALVLVTNEVGCGIVPANPLSRAFRDHQGRLNQSLARACARVVLVVAGCPLQIKPGNGASITD